VETPFYVVAAAFVIFIAVFWFALNHDKTLLLLAFAASAVFVVAFSAMFGIFGIFLIFPPSLNRLHGSFVDRSLVVTRNP
jgi:hypothetical protein